MRCLALRHRCIWSLWRRANVSLLIFLYNCIACAFSALTLLVGRQKGHPAFCWERGADSVFHCHSHSCFSKIQIGYTFLVPAHLGSPGKMAVKWVCCVYVCVCVCVHCCGAVFRRNVRLRTIYSLIKYLRINAFPFGTGLK